MANRSAWLGVGPNTPMSVVLNWMLSLSAPGLSKDTPLQITQNGDTTVIRVEWDSEGEA